MESSLIRGWLGQAAFSLHYREIRCEQQVQVLFFMKGVAAAAHPDPAWMAPGHALFGTAPVGLIKHRGKKLDELFRFHQECIVSMDRGHLPIVASSAGGLDDGCQ